MKNIKVFLQAFNQPWCISPAAADSYALVLHQILSGTRASFLDEDEAPEEYAFAVNSEGTRIGGIEESNEESVAVINLSGAVMKYDYCGSPGTQSLIQSIKQANANPAIASIVAQVDSPGGAVDGTQQFANAIKNSTKPVVAFINGMACSAAMWGISGASKRIASSTTDVLGSIGTMASWRDLSAYHKAIGIVSHEVYATKSTKKNFTFREANGNNEEGKPNYEPLIKTWLDPLNSEFHSAIMENLPNVDKSVLDGSVYLAKDAMSKGLIDEINTFEYAVKSSLQLAKTIR